MRAVLLALAATMLVGSSSPGITKEPAVLNCRLMTEDTPWLFRQHCKSENFVRLALPKPDELKEPKYKKKHANNKSKHGKKHAILRQKQEKLYRKIRYLEKMLYAELHECKSYKCKLIVKRKLTKLYSYAAYNGISPSSPAGIGDTLGTTTNALSGTTSSLGNSVSNTVSGTTDTLGGATQSAGGVVSGATNTAGGLLK